MTKLTLHSFEAGRRGKPDELDSQLAHLIGAYFLQRDPKARFDLRVEGGAARGELFVNVSGEITEGLLDKETNKNIQKIILNHYNLINKKNLSDLKTKIMLTPQSVALADNKESGDISTALAVAYAGTPNYLPIERWLAVKIRDTIDQIFQAGELNRYSQFKLKADGKVSVNVLYSATKPIIKNVLIATNHEPSLGIEELREGIKIALRPLLLQPRTKVSINGLGAWTDEGGWYFDRGSREAKPPRDAFGSYGMVEDSFSGEDPSKPSATATFLARYIAVQVVGNNLAKFARVGLLYDIGGHQPELLNIVTNETSRISQKKLENWIYHELPDLSIGATIERFGLRDPKLYQKIARNSDFFHDPTLPWNKLKLYYR